MLDGWTPRTFYEYDDENRLVSSWTEPEWDEVEVGWMLALAEYRDSLCPLCGGPKDICQAPEFTYNFGFAPPVRCRVATALDESREQHKDTKHASALLHVPLIAPYGMQLTQ